MASAVKLSDEMVALARREARLMKRSIAGQVEYWASLGRAIEAAGLLDAARVRAVLEGEGSVHGLDPEQTRLYLELLGDAAEQLDGSDTRRIRAHERAGHPVAGEDETGKLVVRRRRRAAG
jgi:hypothetical protein